MPYDTDERLKSYLDTNQMHREQTVDSRWRTALSAAKWLRTSRGWVRLAGRIDDEQDIDAGI